MDCKPYSYSRLRLYRQCPHALSLRMLHGSRSTDLMRIGSSAHEVFRAYAEFCQKTGVRTDLDAVEKITGLVARAQHLNGHEMEDVLEIGRIFAENHIIEFCDNPEQKIGIVGVVPCAFDDPMVYLRGIIDCLSFPADGPAKITDYKTGWDTHPDWFQMDVYAYLVFCAHQEVDQITAEIDFVRHNIQKTQTYDRNTDFERLLVKIVRIIKMIQSDDEMAPTPGAHCQHCEYVDVCEAKIKALGAVKDAADAAQLADNIAITERMLTHAKSQLKAYVKENGPVTRGGQTWAFHKEGDMGFEDAEEFLDMAAEASVKDPYQYLTVDNRKARKLRKDGEYPEALRCLLVPRYRVRFVAKKAITADDVESPVSADEEDAA